MAEWKTPITDRTASDVTTAKNNQANASDNKGALNFNDLNRIENNYKYLLDRLKSEGYYINHKYRSYTETEAVVEKVDNGSTGTFEYGEETYTQVEYLESSGTQYIDTGFNADGNTEIAIDVDLISGTTSYPTPFGAWNGSGEGAFGLIKLNDSTVRIYYGTAETDVSASVMGRHTIKMTKGTVELDGELLKTISDATFSVTYPMLLLAFNDTGNVINQITAKLYSCQIYDNNALVRDYVPVKDASGAGYLFDKVNGIPYTNAGNGSFTVGAEAITDPTPKYNIQYIKTLYTDWFEQNLPWKSEMDRIRDNINNLLGEYLQGKHITPIDKGQYLDYIEANKIEDIELTTEDTINQMKTQYRLCNTFKCGEGR